MSVNVFHSISVGLEISTYPGVLRIVKVVFVRVGSKNTRHTTDVETEKPTTNGREGANGVDVVHLSYHGEVVVVPRKSYSNEKGARQDKTSRTIKKLTRPRSRLYSPHLLVPRAAE